MEYFFYQNWSQARCKNPTPNKDNYPSLKIINKLLIATRYVLLVPNVCEFNAIL